MAKENSIEQGNPKNKIGDYLDGKLSPKELTRFERWIKEDPELAKAVRLQRKIKYAFDHPNLQDDIALIKQSQKNAEKNSLRTTILLVGLVLIGLVFMWLYFS